MQNNIVINDEIGAYAYEIELLNLMMEGELKKAAQEEREIDISKLEAISKNQQDINNLQFILDLAKLYYHDDLQGIQYHNNSLFTQKIADLYAQRGSKIWIKLKDGRLMDYFQLQKDL